MHAIGYVTNVVTGKHFPGHLSVQFTDPITSAAEIQGQPGHIETILPGKLTDLRWQKLSQGFFRHIIRKQVMTSRHRGVGGEGTGVANPIHVSVEVMVESQGNKGGMTFVHVVGGDSLFQSLQSFVSTYAQDRFLTNTSMTVAAIKVLSH